MSYLVPLFPCMTFIYFNYLSISYKDVLLYMSDMFLSSSSVHHLKSHVLRELDLSILLIRCNKGRIRLYD
jgi:hypothetical protein